MSPRESAIGAILPARRKLALPAMLAIALGLFVVAAIALTANLTGQRDSFGWVEHTNEVIRTVSAVERGILEAERPPSAPVRQIKRIEEGSVSGSS